MLRDAGRRKDTLSSEQLQMLEELRSARADDERRKITLRLVNSVEIAEAKTLSFAEWAADGWVLGTRHLPAPPGPRAVVPVADRHAAGGRGLRRHPAFAAALRAGLRKARFPDLARVARRALVRGDRTRAGHAHQPVGRIPDGAPARARRRARRLRARAAHHRFQLSRLEFGRARLRRAADIDGVQRDLPAAGLGLAAALAFGSGLAAHEQRETFHGFPP